MAKAAIYDLMETFPVNFTLKSMVVDGQQQTVTSLTAIDRDRSLAYFNYGGSTVIVDCKKITLIEI